MDSFHQAADDRCELTVTRLLLLNIFSFFRLYSELLGCEDALTTQYFHPAPVDSAGRLFAAKQARGQR